MKKLNLRLRLMVFFVLISAAVFVTAGILSWKECREKVDEFFDTYQIALARQLSTADWSHITLGIQKISDRLVDDIHNADDEDESIGFAVFSNEGKRIFHDGENGKDFPPFGRTGSFGTERIDDEDWRVIRLMSTDSSYIVAVGQELDYRNEIVEDMFEEFMTPWGIGLAVLLAAIILMLTKEFSPLNRLAQKLKKRKAEDLSPLDETGIPGEVRPLTEAVNQLFRRIEDMLQREKSFIADSAHELRSPLTALKVQLEVAEMSADNPQALAQALRKLEQGIDRSTRLVEQLLAFSRIEAGFDVLPGEANRIDWVQTAAQITEEYQPMATAKNITIISDISGKAPFDNGNPVWAALLLRNLIDNAVKYSPEGAKVTLTIQNGRIRVCNSETTVDEEQICHLGQRFYRPAGQKTTGSGLGLSIIGKIAALYGCRIEFANTPEGFCVTVFSGKE